MPTGLAVGLERGEAARHHLQPTIIGLQVVFAPEGPLADFLGPRGGSPVVWMARH
jgi:hypothetical protein